MAPGRAAGGVSIKKLKTKKVTLLTDLEVLVFDCQATSSAPEQDCFIQGIEIFKQRYRPAPESSGQRSFIHDLLRLGKQLRRQQLEGLARAEAEEEEDPAGDLRRGGAVSIFLPMTACGF